MTKEEHQALKKQFLEEKQRVYDAEPQVKNWIGKKRTIWRILAAYWLIHAALTIAAMVQMGNGIQVLTDIVRPLFQLFWLYVFISPNGTWRINLVLYFWAFSNLMLNLNNYMQNLQGYFGEAVRQMPVLGIVFGMEVFVPFLFLGAACYLTLPKKHRELSERAQTIQKELSEIFKTTNGT